jgi:hypothetical protein
MIGIIAGCPVSFFLLRFLAKEWAMKQISKRKKLRIVVSAVTNHAFKVIFLMRFTPIPFGFQNTLYAVSGVKFWTFFFATVLGMMPDALLYVYAGSQARKLSDVVSGKSHLEEWEKWLLGGQIGLIIILFIAVIFIGRRALKKAVEEEERKAAIPTPINIESADPNFISSPYDSTKFSHSDSLVDIVSENAFFPKNLNDNENRRHQPQVNSLLSDTS